MDATATSTPAPAPPPVPILAQRKKKKKRGLLWFFAVLMVLAAAGAGVYFYRTRDQGVTVETEKVAHRNLTEVVVATGRIQPVLEVKISPEVSGEIIELPVKEGQRVNKGDLILKIKPDFYIANTNSAHANYLGSQAGMNLAQANLEKAEMELRRFEELFSARLVSESDFVSVKTAFDVAKAQHQSARHQAEMAAASLARACEELSKTTIYSPISGTISRLNSRRGERVVGTATMAGTDVMTIANLEEMEARVDIGEIDVVLIRIGQTARLEVDAFEDKKFSGTVYEIANSAKVFGAGQQQEATKFEVKIRITEKDPFLPGMSVTADIETRFRTNVLAVPIQSVTTRLPKGVTAPPPPGSPGEPAEEPENEPGSRKKKTDEKAKPIEVVFKVNSGQAKMVPVKRGVSDDTYVEIVEGLSEGEEIVSGSYRAINRELEDGRKIKVAEKGKPKKADRDQGQAGAE